MVLGVALLSHAANTVVFLSAGLNGILDGAHMPIIPRGETALATPHADPLPQAFVLTAIVIAFGVMAFLIALAWRTYMETGTDDLSEIWKPEEETAGPMEGAKQESTPPTSS